MTPLNFLPWMIIGIVALLCFVGLRPRLPVWSLFCLGMAATCLHEGIETLSGWLFANARPGYSFEQWLAAAMATWRWHVWLGLILDPLKALIIAPILAWAIDAKPAMGSNFVERYRRYREALVQIARQPVLDKEPDSYLASRRLVRIAREAIEEK